MVENVANAGSAIGEAIGHHMEITLHNYIDTFLEDYSCHFLKEIGYLINVRRNSCYTMILVTATILMA